ncbi:Uma2 family endonuclease [Streptomyces mutabilis]|uniref:Uma2 family endonuclease n=1 Tax=Streptomyces mutabilis TaxID=67332 RepID=UPI0022BA667F|nr:Uma2 family endonuclease [Streptomyces mutabilis]MCZ9348610.1 Uma2 family endonuclease [Streptomyces mutabilis]
MTAESVEHRRPRWPVPPMDGYTVDDLFTLPDLPPHTELIDGSLIFVSPQRRFHYLVIDLLFNGLRNSLPPEFSVEREMTVLLDDRNGPEPDISVVRADTVTGLDQTSFRAEDVLLAVEVVSPESESRDRTTKPHKYAAAGIPSFWRVERGGANGGPVVHVHELDPRTKAYVHTGLHRDVLKVDRPYAIGIDLSALGGQ